MDDTTARELPTVNEAQYAQLLSSGLDGLNAFFKNTEARAHKLLQAFRPSVLIGVKAASDGVHVQAAALEAEQTKVGYGLKTVPVAARLTAATQDDFAVTGAASQALYTVLAATKQLDIQLQTAGVDVYFAFGTAATLQNGNFLTGKGSRVSFGTGDAPLPATGTIIYVYGTGAATLSVQAWT